VEFGSKWVTDRSLMEERLEPARVAAAAVTQHRQQIAIGVPSYGVRRRGGNHLQNTPSAAPDADQMIAQHEEGR